MANKSTQSRNDAVNAIRGPDWFALHTADPGITGAAEVSGGSPAYQRKQATFPAASSGSSANTGVSINVPLGVTVTHWSRHTASTGGSTFYRGGPLPAAEGFGSQGTYTLQTTITEPA